MTATTFGVTKILKRIFGAVHEEFQNDSTKITLPDLWPAVEYHSSNYAIAPELAQGHWYKSNPLFYTDMPSDMIRVQKDTVCLDHLVDYLEDDPIWATAIRASRVAESDLFDLVNEFHGPEIRGLVCFESDLRRVRAILVYSHYDLRDSSNYEIRDTSKYWLLYRDLSLEGPYNLLNSAINPSDPETQDGSYPALILFGTMFYQAFSHIATNRSEDGRNTQIDILSQHHQVLDSFSSVYQLYLETPILSPQRW